MVHSAKLLALGALILSAAAAAHEEPKPRLLAVSGAGEVSVAPDRADVSLTVEASEKALADAEQKVGDGVVQLLKLCESLGIPKAQVRSAQLSVAPQYDSSGVLSNGRPRIVGYVVSRDVRVDLRDLAKLGKLMQGALDNGANRISGISFDSTKRDEHQREALARAAADAKANAQALAQALGVKLGRLHTLNASESGGMPVPQVAYAARMSAAAAPAEQSYELGEIRFSATVGVEYDLP